MQTIATDKRKEKEHTGLRKKPLREKLQAKEK